ncbi:hypothetical protein K2173_022457 [Erythroxylum novogranatense]|uniref:Endonuclease/exonuclease/phosphatase domain-containing protein n=1 Tax=Erythroxylum novogranatense TaxID=1862640 RepID=A0AAV8TKC3_9ROSI|nr:hypothetical protein K2173_022457 [Erythroxylum novogranatense]
MLGLVSRKVRQLFSRIRRLVWKRLRPKVIIRRFGAKDRCRWKPGRRKSSSSSPGKPIRIATFNVAMFSLAPAVPRTEEPPTLVQERETQARSPNYYPKSILKQSPLHDSVSRSKPKVSINLPDNEISLTQGKFLRFVEDEREGSSHIIASRNYRSSVVMRSPVCLPANMIQYYGRSEEEEERFKKSRSILEVLREVDADVLALQDVKAEEERSMRPLSDLAASLGMKYVFAESWAPEYGNAILSKWPIKRWTVQKIANEDDFRNVLKATICIPWAGELEFYCTQLDHLNENWRMKQINAMIQSNNSPHLLAGGLNSLDASDYSSERWMDIVKYYEDIGKPTPRIEVTRFLKGKGYSDAKEFSGECEPVVMIAKGQNVQGTCKYGTRVDYLLASPDSVYKFVPGSYSVISSKGTSDHHIVKVEITNSSRSCRESSAIRSRKTKQKVIRLSGPCSASGIWKLKH